MIAVLMLLILKPEGTVSAVWSVTFETPDPCALKGSSVKFPCSYSYSERETVRQTEWYKGELKNGLWKRVKLSDLPSYENRSEYVGDLQHDCSLAIHDLQVNDTGHYYFRFYTDNYIRYSQTSVYLTVTDLSVRLHSDTVRAGDNVSLECKTSCQPSNILYNIFWFKDGHPVAKQEFQAQTEDSGSYVCAVQGQGSVQSEPVALDVQHPPLNVSVKVSYPDFLTEKSSLILTCSSAANPAADNYTWYRRTDPSFSSMVQVGSGQVLSLPSLEASHTGFYFCQARNRLGGNYSSKVLLTGDETNSIRLILLVGIGIKVCIVLLLTGVFIWTWRQRRRPAVDRGENDHDYENISKG